MNPEPQGVQAVPCLSVAFNDNLRNLTPDNLLSSVSQVIN